MKNKWFVGLWVLLIVGFVLTGCPTGGGGGGDGTGSTGTTGGTGTTDGGGTGFRVLRIEGEDMTDPTWYSVTVVLSDQFQTFGASVRHSFTFDIPGKLINTVEGGLPDFTSGKTLGTIQIIQQGTKPTTISYDGTSQIRQYRGTAEIPAFSNMSITWE